MALEARAEERDTRGFISMTISSPSAGLTANCTLDPPVSTPISRMMAMADPDLLVLPVCQGLGRGHGNGVARMHAHGSHILNGTDDHHVVSPIGMTSSSYSFQAQEGWLQHDL